jgi:hypothetical protein
MQNWRCKFTKFSDPGVACGRILDHLAVLIVALRSGSVGRNARADKVRLVPSLTANELDACLKKMGKGLLSEYAINREAA